MQYRRFKNSNLETSVVGLGGWPMGRGQYGSFDENEVIKAVHKALDLGVTLFDTAQIYGWGAGDWKLTDEVKAEIETAFAEE